MIIKTLFAVLLAYNPLARADFGEIDLMVRESVENYFHDLEREVDMGTFEYNGNPDITDGIITVSTSVKAVQGFTYQLDWHDCTTKLRIISRGHYEDLGSECYFDFD